MERRDYRQSVFVLLECLSWSRANKGDDSWVTMAVNKKLGLSLLRLNKFKKALVYLRPVYEFRRHHPLQPKAIVHVAKPLGLSLAGAGLHSEAIEVLSGALKTSIALYGTDSSTIWFLRSKLSNSLRAEKDWQSLIELHQTLEERIDFSRCNTRLFVLDLMRNIACAYFKIGAHDKAIELNTQALNIRCAHGNLMTSETLIDMEFAARVLLKMRRHDEATDVLEKSIELSRSITSVRERLQNRLLEKLEETRKVIARRRAHDARVAEQAFMKARAQTPVATAAAAAID